HSRRTRPDTQRFFAGSTKLDSMGVRKTVNNAIFNQPTVSAVGSTRRHDLSTSAAYSNTGGIVTKTNHRLVAIVT
ncbi:MAG: hypothetical protein KGQ32_08560, partial [Xanthomonadaceae bacterium]|nr:hypothetical protein [Xanthomonadaceae bacterium]